MTAARAQERQRVASVGRAARSRSWRCAREVRSIAYASSSAKGLVMSGRPAFKSTRPHVPVLSGLPQCRRIGVGRRQHQRLPRLRQGRALSSWQASGPEGAQSSVFCLSASSLPPRWADAKRLSVHRLGKRCRTKPRIPRGTSFSCIYGNGETGRRLEEEGRRRQGQPRRVRRDVEARGVTTYWTVADLLDEGEVKRSQFQWFKTTSTGSMNTALSEGDPSITVTPL